jgi:hypothetical protein
MDYHKKPIVRLFVILGVLLLGYVLVSFWMGVPASKVKYEDKQAGLSFLYPKSLTEIAKIEPELIRLALPKVETGSGDVPETITFRKPINISPTTTDLSKVLISQVVLDGSGDHPESIDSFRQVEIKGRRFYFIQTGRLEGWLSYDYFLLQDHTLLPIAVRWYIGSRWTDPTFEVKFDPRYAELVDILATVRIAQ